MSAHDRITVVFSSRSKATNNYITLVYYLCRLADVSMRMVRNPVKGAAPSLVFEGSLEFLPFSDFEAAPVSKGSLVLIDGKVGCFFN